MSVVLYPRVGPRWQNEAKHLIKKLRDKGDYKPLLGPACGHTRDHLDLVTRLFDFRKRDFLIRVTLNRQTMVRFLLALMDEPSISLWGPSSSYRSCAYQSELFERYLRGDGGLTAPPGKSWHQTGRSLDAYYATEDERDALLDKGFFDLLPADPPHFTYGQRG